MSNSSSLGWVSMVLQAADSDKQTEGHADVIRFDQLALLLFDGWKDINLNASTGHHLTDVAERVRDIILEDCNNAGMFTPEVARTFFDKKKLMYSIGAVRYTLQVIQNIYSISEQECLQAFADAVSDSYKKFQYSEPGDMERRLSNADN